MPKYTRLIKKKLYITFINPATQIEISTATLGHGIVSDFPANFQDHRSKVRLPDDINFKVRPANTEDIFGLLFSHGWLHRSVGLALDGSWTWMGHLRGRAPHCLG